MSLASSPLLPSMAVKFAPGHWRPPGLDSQPPKSIVIMSQVSHVLPRVMTLKRSLYKPHLESVRGHGTAPIEVISQRTMHFGVPGHQKRLTNSCLPIFRPRPPPPPPPPPAFALNGGRANRPHVIIGDLPLAFWLRERVQKFLRFALSGDSPDRTLPRQTFFFFVRTRDQ